MDDEKLLTNTDVAKLLGIAPRSLEQMRHKGTSPPFVRISSRCVRYRMADVERWIAERLCK